MFGLSPTQGQRGMQGHDEQAIMSLTREEINSQMTQGAGTPPIREHFYPCRERPGTEEYHPECARRMEVWNEAATCNWVVSKQRIAESSTTRPACMGPDQSGRQLGHAFIYAIADRNPGITLHT